MLQNPVPILNQRKSEMTTNPLITGEKNDEIVIYKNPQLFLIETNQEFTKTINEIFDELYKTKSLKLTQRKLKWIVILCIIVLVMYIIFNLKIE